MRAAKEKLDEDVALRKWERIKMQCISDEISQGRAWLQEYRSLPLAGDVFARMLELKPNDLLRRQAIKWLRECYSFEHASDLIAVLITPDCPDEVWRAASIHLTNFSKTMSTLAPGESLSCQNYRHFFHALILQTTKPSLAYRAQEIGLSLNQLADSEWLFPISTYKKRNRRVESLTARWLNMPIEHDETSLTVICCLTPCKAVTEGVLNWIKRNSCNCNGHLIHDALNSSHNYPSLLPQALRYARKWVRQHPDDNWLGLVHGTLLAVGSTRDRAAALSWYKKNGDNDTAKFVLSNELNYCAFAKKRPSDYIIAESKAYLLGPGQESGFPVLLGALLKAAPDDEVIGWARDFLSKKPLLWLLHVLLSVDRSAESVAFGLKIYDQTLGSKMDSITLGWLLHVDRHNEKVVSRAKAWLKKNPDGEYWKEIRAYLKD